MSGYIRLCEANYFMKSVISLKFPLDTRRRLSTGSTRLHICTTTINRTSTKSTFFHDYLGASSQFKKQSYSTVDSLGTAYDYQSMMHYNWNAFGRPNGDFALQTIRTKDRSKQWLLGQRDGFSKIDVIQINQLYQCRGMYV